MKAANYHKGTKYGLKEIPVGQTKIFFGEVRKNLTRAMYNYNQVLDRGEWILIEAVQDGDKVIVKRIF